MMDIANSFISDSDNNSDIHFSTNVDVFLDRCTALKNRTPTYVIDPTASDPSLPTFNITENNQRIKG